MKNIKGELHSESGKRLLNFLIRYKLDGNLVIFGLIPTASPWYHLARENSFRHIRYYLNEKY